MKNLRALSAERVSGGLSKGGLMLAGVLAACAGQAAGQWSDDFNRANGPIGGPWVANGGNFANFSIAGNRGAHANSSNDAMRHATASRPYQFATQTIDLHLNPGGTQYVALGSGYGAGNNLYLKLQSNAGSQFDKIGFYSGLNSLGGWPGASPALDDLAAPFTSGRMQAYFTGGGDTANVVIDTNFDGVPDQSYARSGVRAFMAGSGTGFGVGGFGPARFDNWRIMPAIFPPAAAAGQFLAPFGQSSTHTVHQAFRAGLWETPVRITGVRYASVLPGPWTGAVSIGLGYTPRTVGVLAPAGLDIPSGGDGAPNATGVLFPYFTNAAYSTTLVAGVAPIAEDFQLAFNSTPGFVYFPGIGNLLMQTQTTVGATTDVGVTRALNGADSSVTFATSRFGNGSGVSLDAAPLVQFVAMPVTPDVLPTWPHVLGNVFPFGESSLLHEVRHAGTIAPLGVGVGGSGKVAIQGLRVALVSGVLAGDVDISMGYTSRVPGVAGASGGLLAPAAGGGGVPNASGSMEWFFDQSVNRTVVSGGTNDFNEDFHQRPFVFNPAFGNLLVEFSTQLTDGVPASRAGGSAEGSRAYLVRGIGGDDPARAMRLKFMTTPVSEQVYPETVPNGGLNVPFSPGSHVTHQVFSAAQFGDEPVRIDSIAYSAAGTGSIGSTVTVRMGYTSRQPGVGAPAGLSPPLGAEGDPNVAFGPMATFWSGSYSVTVVAVDPDVYQIVFKGDMPFLYNPALGNLLVQVESSASGPLPVSSILAAPVGSSIAVTSTVFGSAAYPAFAPLVKFTYYKDLYPCVADMTGDGTVDLSDFFGFFGCWDTSAQCADVDGVPGVDLGDFFGFLASWDVGC